MMVDEMGDVKTQIIKAVMKNIEEYLGMVLKGDETVRRVKVALEGKRKGDKWAVQITFPIRD